MKRRTFVRNLGMGTGGLTLGLSFNQCSTVSEKKQYGKDLFQRFQNPLSEARPFFRWWWNGNRITSEEAIRQMGLMHHAGAGGVEINPIEMHETVINPTGKEIEWLSEEWSGILRQVCDEAMKKGMIADLIVGTGWPFGGKFLQPDEWLQGLVVRKRDYTNISVIEEKLIEDQTANQRVKQLLLFRKDFSRFHEAIDLTEALAEDGSIRYELDRGDYILFITLWKNGFREVMHGAPGGDGPVLDHFNRRAVEKYLNNMSDKLKSHFNGNMGSGIRAMFCDSIELNGANWTTDFAAEFEKRRGYSLFPYLPFLIDMGLEVSAPLARELSGAKYDYSLTLSELFTERFIRPYHDWCHENGTLSRYQAYGFPWLYTDLIDGYLIPDIPESDQWLYNPGWVRTAVLDDIRYAIWNKYASSAAHLKGRKIISCEAMTNTSGVFEATLEYMKQATDINILCGINHLVFHGFNYSPPEAGFPGWIRYGEYFNENNPWWPYLRYYIEYTSRLCQVFQDSRQVSQIAILGPTSDVWAQKGLERTAFNLTPWYIHALWQALNHHGFCSDYVNGKILQGATFENGVIHYGPAQYKGLLLCNVETVDLLAGQAILRFVEQGGKVFFIGSVPDKAPGRQQNDEMDLEIKKLFTVIMKTGNAELLEDPPLPENGFIDWVGSKIKGIVTPGVQISNPHERLFYIQHCTDDQSIFFFCNTSRHETVSFEAIFENDGQPVQWDVESGSRFEMSFREGKVMEIMLDPLESRLIVFEENPTGDLSSPGPSTQTEILRITGPWDVNFSPVIEQPFSRSLDQLVDWSSDPGLSFFSGQAIYKTYFEMESIRNNMYLDLGDVKDISEVSLNGQNLGVKWWGKHRYSIPSGVGVTGQNLLEVKVTNVLFNYMLSIMDRNETVRYWLDRAENRLASKGLELQPLSGGLLGPVRIIAQSV